MYIHTYTNTHAHTTHTYTHTHAYTSSTKRDKNWNPQEMPQLPACITRSSTCSAYLISTFTRRAPCHVCLRVSTREPRARTGSSEARERPELINRSFGWLFDEHRGREADTLCPLSANERNRGGEGKRENGRGRKEGNEEREREREERKGKNLAACVHNHS